MKGGGSRSGKGKGGKRGRGGSGRINAMQALLRVQDGGHWQLNDPDKLRATMDAASAVAQACDEPRFQGVGEHGCGKLILKKSQKPNLWCSAARNVKTLAKKAIEDHIQGRLERESRRRKDPEAFLRQKKGFFGASGPVTWKQAMYFGEETKQSIIDRYRALYTAAGLEAEVDSAWFSGQVEYKDALRAAADKLAPTLKAPKGKKQSYAVKLIKAKIKAKFPKVRFYRVWMRPENWKTDARLEIDTPRRQWNGWALYKLPGDKWCQLMDWYVREDYKGGGKWQRSNNVNWQGVRFQSCK